MYLFSVFSLPYIFVYAAIDVGDVKGGIVTWDIIKKKSIAKMNKHGVCCALYIIYILCCWLGYHNGPETTGASNSNCISIDGT